MPKQKANNSNAGASSNARDQPGTCELLVLDVAANGSLPSGSLPSDLNQYGKYSPSFNSNSSLLIIRPIASPIVQ